MTTLQSVEPCALSATGTFRDPQGRLYRDGDRILREIYPESVGPALDWLRSPLAQRWMQQGRMIPTEILSSQPEQLALLEHERVFFPSYPWEWTPGQWIHAASLTLDLCEDALESGFILKDATPLNILFSGPRAVFVDVLSFEQRDAGSPLWIAYAQFVRTFLLPLAAYAYLGWPLSATAQRRDGYEPADLAPWLALNRRWRYPLRSLITLPMLFEKRLHNKDLHTQSRKPRPSEVSALVIRRTLRSTRKLLHSVASASPVRSSRWSHYTETASHYESADHDAKKDFVSRSLEQIHPARVLDVGANTGVYSRVAAATGAEVVAWDTDLQATDLNWQTAIDKGLQILPLIADFARPTPALGWQNQETGSLLSRARGQFDCVLMLGILHHLLLADQIPLPAVLNELAEISRRWAVVEWIPQGDSQFNGLCRGRQQLYSHLTEEYFVQQISKAFKVQVHEKLPNGRSLWLLEKLS